MKHRFFTLCLLLVLTAGISFSAFRIPVYAAPAREIFVSPQGDDAAAGTLDAPLQTLSAAKEKLKTLKSAVGEDENVRVWLRGGRYELTETLCFTGDDLPNVTFAAYKNEKATVSGARAVTGFAGETVNGVTVFTKTLDPAKDPTGFHSLFSETEQLPVPRYPEEGYFTVNRLCPEDDLWTEEDTPWDFTRGQRSFCADPADLTEFTNPTDVQVRVLHYWHDELMYLTDVDYATGKLSLSRPSAMLIQTIDRFYFENVFEALDAPGEWYLDRETNKLYYVPEEGESADALTLKASSLELLLDLDGVSGIAFEGIRFTETDWNVPTPTEWDGWRGEKDIDALQAALDVKGVVTVKHAENVSFTHCEFTNLGADGVKFMNGARHCRVDSCLFRNIAATGVFIGGANGQPEDPETCADITVTNNLIDGYGRKFYCAIGVHITYCDGAEISHNEITDGYYTAISCGWIWGYVYHLTKDIKITDNLIYNIGQGWLSDMGGIYMLGTQPGTVLSGNVIHNVAADPGEGGYGGWGIYLDEGSSRMLVERNLVYCCGSQSFNIHYGEGNIIRNNIGALSAEGQVSVGTRGGEPHATAYYYDNIFLTDNGAPVYLYMYDTGHFYENGNLFWDLSKGDGLCFAKDSGKDCLTLKAALREGFLHNPTAADPLFADAAGCDFTLAEDSPAFALNFKAWDYGSAGTLKGTTIGTDQPGGGTAYNDHATAVTSEKKYASFSLGNALALAALALAALTLLLWLGRAALRSGDATPLCVTALAVVCGAFAYRWFIHWTPVLYAVSAVAMLACAAVLPLLAAGRNGSKRRPVFTWLLWFGIEAAVFFAATLTFNNGLRIGEARAISIAFSVVAIVSLVHTFRLFAAGRKTTP